jgi:hypothetical protein
LIAGAEGVISLSVPLEEGRNQNRSMRGVVISNAENWQTRHFKSIQSAYNRSPFFEYYRHELAEVFQKRFELLAEWDLYCLNWVKEKLECRVETLLTEKTIPFGAEGITDLRNLVLPKNYTRWNPVIYRQVFEERTGFFPNLSILDLLFNEGKNAKELLRNSNLET